MKTSLQHLSPLRRQQLQTITRIIRQAVEPEKILLYGPYAANSGVPDSLSSYHIMVITRRRESRHATQVQDTVENSCRILTPITVWVNDIDFVNDQRSKGQFFFTFLDHEAILLYDAGIVALAAAAPPDWASIRETAQKDFEVWTHRAQAFFESAAFSRSRRENPTAAFLLHQAAEQAYHAILLVFIGYKPATHNLDKLRRYTERFSVELAALFPRDQPGELHLFKLLLHAYLNARYESDYHLETDDLDLLTGRVRELLSITRRICRNRLILLDKILEGVQ